MMVVTKPAINDWFESESWRTSDWSVALHTFRRQLKAAAAVWPELAKFQIEEKPQAKKK